MKDIKSPRLRAAPSPTGRVHIGNLRTFFYSYLFVKARKGRFILRIEDTDQKRKVEGGTEAIIEVLRMYGIEFDEGPIKGGDFGPYIQTERREIYKKYAGQMLEKGHAYRCFCTTERLQKMRESQQKSGELVGYDGKCRNLDEEEVKGKVESGDPFVIRMKFPEDGFSTFKDLVYGDVKVPNNSIDDQVILKSDSLPTYHFAVVVDDSLMGITHVVRGREYLSDTPKNLFIYESLGWDVPEFVHVPHILKPEGKGKLGKRDGALPAIGYLKKGFLPEAVLNYITLIGWSPPPESAREDEIYSIDQLVSIFDFTRIQKTGGRYDPKKLDSINGKHIRLLSVDQLAETVLEWAKDIVLRGSVADQFEEKDEWESDLEAAINRYLPVWESDIGYFKEALTLVHERLTYFAELPKLLDFFYDEKLGWSMDDWKFKEYTPAEIADALDTVLPELDQIFSTGDFTDHDIWEKVVRENADKLGWKHGVLFMAIRSASTGRLQSPPLLESFQVMGWDRTRKHIGDSVAWLREQ